MSTFRLTLEPRKGLIALVAGLFGITALLPLSADPAGAATGANDVSVIVQKASGVGDAPERLVRRLGGTVTYDLSIINGFAATVDASQVAALQRSNAVRFVTDDAPAQVSGVLGDTDAAVQGVTSAVDETVSGTLDATTQKLLPTDLNPVVSGEADAAKVNAPQPNAEHVSSPVDEEMGTTSVYQDEIGVTGAHASGVDGKGVTVALIDTGVTSIPDLQGRLVKIKTPNGGTKTCVDLSGEGTCTDSYGHGTFLAGLIAGNGSASNGEYAGVAPGAKILSVKLAGRDGSASVGKIIYAIQWVTQYGPQYGVKVMNLSLGTDSKQSYKVDPLNYAVERAWRSGISVVVAAGNRGAGEKTISKPADDPLVLTTGAVDDRHSTDPSDDVIPTFTSRGPTASDGLVKPDITVPGTLLISTRAPNSAIEEKFPNGGVDATYRRGSGTSQSAAVLSGAVALLLQAHPNLTPNQVKYAIMHSARSIPAESNPNVVGAGMLDIDAAITTLPVGEANRGVRLGNGEGSLEKSQGSIRLAVKQGEQVLGVLGSALPVTEADPSDPSGLRWLKTGWYGGDWYGGDWYGGDWYGGDWYGGDWYGGDWYGGDWYGGDWYGGDWYGGDWYGGDWYGGDWYGAWD